MAGPGAGGGGQGAAWDPEFQDYQMDLLANIAPAAGDTFTSSMVDIINTAVAAGGNPYANEAAYNPVAEVTKMEDVADALDGKVKAFNHRVSWDAFVTAVQSRLAEFNLDGDPVASTVSSIVNAAVSDVATKYATLADTAETEGDALADKAEADADSVVGTLQTSIEADASVAADSVVSDGVTAVTGQADDEQENSREAGLHAADVAVQQAGGMVQAVNDTLQDNAVSKGITDGASVVSGGVSSGVTHAGTVYDDVEADADDSVEMQVEGGRHKATTVKVDVNADALVDSDAAADAALTSGQTDAGTVRSTVQTAARADVTTDIASATSDAQTKITALIKALVASTQGDLQNVVTSIVQAAKQAVNSSTISDLRDEYEDRKLNTHLRSLARYASGMADLNAVQHSTFVIGMGLMEMEFDRDVNDFDKQLSFDLFRSGLNVSMNVASNMLAAGFNGYQQLVDTYMRVLLQDSDNYTRSIVELFGARLQSYMQLMPQYFGAYSDIIGKYVTGSRDLMSLKAGLAGTLARAESDVSATLAGVRVQSDSALTGGHVNAGLQYAGQRNALFDGMFKTRGQSFDRMFATEGQLAGQVYGASSGARVQLAQQVSRMFESFVNSQLDATVRNDLMRESLKQDFVKDSVRNLHQLLSKEYDMSVMNTQLSLEAQRYKAVLFSEQYVQDLQIDVGDARWDMEAMQYAANAAAAGFGGTVTTPAAMTKTQSILGGTLAGASLGASTGNPLLMGAGALVGGIAGWATR